MLVNETIDDTDPRIIFDPHDLPQAEAWAVSGGYHTTNSLYTAVVYTFQGSAIYVNCLRDTTGAGSISVTLDDIPLGPFSLVASSPALPGSGIVFSKTDLDPTLNHTIIVRKIPDNIFEPNVNTNLSFDSFIVTQDTDAPQATSAASNPIPKMPLDVTIDDQDSRVRYTSGGEWFLSTPWNTYGSYNGTLHISVRHPNKAAFIYFKGSAIRVTALRWWCGSNFTVSLDGVETGPYNLLTDDPTQISTQVIFTAQNLDPQSIHLIAISALPDSPTFVSRISTISYMNVDSFIITNGDVVDPNTPGLPTFSPHTSPIPSPLSTSTPANSTLVASQNPPVGPIVGGVVGGLAALSLLIIAIYLFRRNRASLSAYTGPSATTIDAGQGHPQDIFSVTPFTVSATSPGLSSNITARAEKTNNPITLPNHPAGPATSGSSPITPPALGEGSSSSSSALARGISRTETQSSRDATRNQAVQDQIEELRREVRRLQQRESIPPPLYEEPQ